MMTTHRTLVVGVNWIGDTLFMTPALRALKQADADGHIACLVPPRVAEVLRHHPAVNELLTYNDRASFWSFGALAATIAKIKRGKFDRAVLFHRSKTKAWMVRKAGVPESFGFEIPEGRAPMHKIDLFLHQAQLAGVSAQGRHMEFFPAPEAAHELEALTVQHDLSLKDRYVVVHAGGNWDLKRWPVLSFVKTIRYYLATLGLRVILCGTSSDQRVCDEIRSHFTEKEVVSLCGKTSLHTLALLLKHAQCLLSNDSGPIHLAASQKTPVLGLFGPTSPELTGPASLGPMKILWKDVGCTIPCYYRSCDHRVCMEKLSVAEVCDGTRELLHV